MISKAKIKYIRSLEQKKNRHNEGVFVAEGPKIVGDFLEIQTAVFIACTARWKADNTDWQYLKDTETTIVTDEELKKISFLQHPQEVLAIFRQAENKTTVPDIHQLYLALDGIQDPGNLGTIIRIADWFGIEHIYCSMDTADIYNPKTVQASMGSLAHIGITYTDIPQLIDSLPTDYPIYGTQLDGKNIYNEPLTSHGLLIMGNEGNGISMPVKSRISRKLLIPNYSQGRKTTDSLNVAIATAIACSEFCRRQTTNKL